MIDGTSFVYLDNAATTQALPEVCRAVEEALRICYGNPSSTHPLGTAAEEILRHTRRLLAEFLGVSDRHIIFTSGGTEANNLAIIGTAMAHAKSGRHIITSAVEHPAVLAPLAYLESKGWRITRIGVDAIGRVSPEAVAAAVSEDTVLVSIMAVNNEVGVIQPLAEIAGAVKKRRPQVLVHTDAVQALGKIELKPLEQGIDLASVSAHKLHGPKGVGALWHRPDLRLEPIIHGGGQENGRRSGTENVPGIAGFGQALRSAMAMGQAAGERLAGLRLKLIEGIEEIVPRSALNGPRTSHAAPHICNISWPGWTGEMLVRVLAEKGLYTSSAAACSSRRKNKGGQGSHVLRAMGLSPERVQSAVRFSFSLYQEEKDIDAALAIVAEVAKQLDDLKRRSR